jgi:DNA-binding NarL/FixJ family response regulator
MASLEQPTNRSLPRVVIVDDDPTFREAARMLLEVRGYDVVGEASCAATAVTAVERNAPDAVLLDVRLGDADGFALCSSLTRFFPELMVLLASVDEPADPELITRCGARGFVQKSRIHKIDFVEFWAQD